jgi:acetyl esterase
VGGDTKDAGADLAEIPVNERADGPGVSRIDPNDPAAPIYYLLERMRSPLSWI